MYPAACKLNQPYLAHLIQPLAHEAAPSSAIRCPLPAPAVLAARLSAYDHQGAAAGGSQLPQAPHQLLLVNPICGIGQVIKKDELLMRGSCSGGPLLLLLLLLLLGLGQWWLLLLLL